MREIKFRAWDKLEKRIDEVVRLDFKSKYPVMVKGISFNEDMCVLMQFTGLLDKNGKEIYEGDIVRVWAWLNEDEPETNEYKDYKVYYDDEYTAFMVDWEYDDVEEHSLGVAISFWDNDRDLAVDWQIIGNIYENPELLEKP